MWYLGMVEKEIKAGQVPGWWRPMCYAESKDGIHWTKPELGLVEYNGSKANNICQIEAEVYSMTRINDFLSVLHEPEDPDPAKRYKCAYIAHLPFDEVKGGRSKIGPNERRWGATIYTTSTDGLSWKVVGDRPANAGGEHFEVSSLYRFGDFYYSTGQLLSPWAWRPDGSDIGRDGFGHLSRKVPENDAHFITSPFTARKISLNVDGITPEAQLKVSPLDPLYRSIQDYEAEIRQNGLHQEIRWPQLQPREQQMALRVDFPANYQAQVYALYVED